MKLRLLTCAELELAEAVDYYNSQLAGLGFEFAAEVKSTLERIVSCPSAWPRLSKRSRRCLVNRFPYGVLYQQDDASILVVAVMHLSRSPRRWQQHLRPDAGME